MKKMRPVLLTMLVSLSSFQLIYAQGFKDKFFGATSITSLLDVAQLPTYNYLSEANYNGENQLVGSYTAITPLSISYLTFGVKLRYNLVEFSTDASLSIQTHPALGISVSMDPDVINLDGSASQITDIGSFSLPIMIGFNNGNISTYKSSKKRGLGCALGVEYFNGGLIKSGVTKNEVHYTDMVTNQTVYIENTKQKTGQLLAPAMEVSYRYFSKYKKTREISFLASFSGKKNLQTNSAFQAIDQIGSAKAPFHFRIIWSSYFGH